MNSIFKDFKIQLSLISLILISNVVFAAEHEHSNLVKPMQAEETKETEFYDYHSGITYSKEELILNNILQKFLFKKDKNDVEINSN